MPWIVLKKYVWIISTTSFDSTKSDTLKHQICWRSNLLNRFPKTIFPDVSQIRLLPVRLFRNTEDSSNFKTLLSCESRFHFYNNSIDFSSMLSFVVNETTIYIFTAFKNVNYEIGKRITFFNVNRKKEAKNFTSYLSCL